MWKYANLYYSSLGLSIWILKQILFIRKAEYELDFCQMESVCDWKIGLLPATKIGVWKSVYKPLD